MILWRYRYGISGSFSSCSRPLPLKLSCKSRQMTPFFCSKRLREKITIWVKYDNVFTQRKMFSLKKFHNLTARQKGWINWVTFLHHIAIHVFQLLGIASTVCKKYWIWQLLQKKKKNENDLSEFSDRKINSFSW